MELNKVELLLLQREQAWDKEEWIVPLAVALDGLTAKVAAWEPVGGGNSIWQTLLHINYYNEDLLYRLRNQPLGPRVTNKATFGTTGQPDDEEGWQAVVARAHELAEGLRETIASLSDEDLEKPFASSTIGQELSIWLLHDAYHSGQIVLIRRQLGAWRQ
ncbi:DinB family protein [Paenibacillus sp. 1011MAR3C5]|uniref:DinB family protein n=1 Tax=Paenibacillus sp. 1011MAR3C5 TaxID=1675787 RepID=UPI000E6BE2D0|nr:DinB family protein [Paenibacillus sp. 1011MAR3C5]RJE85162.1 DinB family protein [Paenibacillus sp. 1011MAR3C5]